MLSFKEGAMYLYLVQHGVPKSKEEDPERSLSDKGTGEVDKVASSVSAFVGAVRIFQSGKLRAEQTAEILGRHLKANIEKAEGLSPMDDPSMWAERLSKEEADTMLVGHLPHLQRLSSLLLSGDSEKRLVEFRMGGVLCLKRDDEGWSLQWMAVPDMYK
jgi:phosphohistidine phosphatase